MSAVIARFSAQPFRAAGCMGKEAFTCFDTASRIAGRMRRRHKGEQIRVYRCEHCPHWHIGRPSSK